jgi:hypothetical protein
LVGIDRLVQLTRVGVDADLAEHAFHAEGARLVRHDGHDVLAESLSRASLVSSRTKPIVVETSRPLAAFEELLVLASGGTSSWALWSAG